MRAGPRGSLGLDAVGYGRRAAAANEPDRTHLPGGSAPHLDRASIDASQSEVELALGSGSHGAKLEGRMSGQRLGRGMASLAIQLGRVAALLQARNLADPVAELLVRLRAETPIDEHAVPEQ